MWEREATSRVKDAVLRLFPDEVESVLNLLLTASGSERVHADILALSFGNRERLAELAATAKEDFRSVVVCEEFPEEFLDIANRPKAAAELARRLTMLGFDVAPHTAYWAQFA